MLIRQKMIHVLLISWWTGLPVITINAHTGYIPSTYRSFTHRVPYRPYFYYWLKKPNECYACQVRKSVQDVLQRFTYAKTFLEILKTTDSENFYEELAAKYNGAVTIFVPSDLAFSALPVGLQRLTNFLIRNRRFLKSMLQYMALPGRVKTTSFSPGAFISSCQGRKVYVSETDCINSGCLLSWDKEFSYGVIHVVNRVMYPIPSGTLWTTISNCPSLTTLAYWIYHTGLQYIFKRGELFTIFAPVNEAFLSLSYTTNQSLSNNPELLKAVLRGHVIPGIFYSSNLYEGQVLTTIEGTNVPCELREIYSHVYHNETDENISSNNQQPTRNTVEILQDRRFSNLTSLIDQAGLKNSLSGEGPFTIFAPTNMAFERLSPDILEKITSDNDVLKRVLEYHVVSGQKLLLRDLRNGQELKTLQSNEPPLKIGLLNRRYPTVNTVRIVRGNLQGKNGVIHTIDRVLIPPSIANGKEKPEEP
ncbi:periostin-like [Tachypleus tridentatus]|uniref:periostin-like n=1 Tax=Tachypleus tridentatus TaxID=6853 RepID=UPI003FCEFA6C